MIFFIVTKLWIHSNSPKKKKKLHVEKQKNTASPHRIDFRISGDDLGNKKCEKIHTRKSNITSEKSYLLKRNSQFFQLLLFGQCSLQKESIHFVGDFIL